MDVKFYSTYIVQDQVQQANLSRGPIVSVYTVSSKIPHLQLSAPDLGELKQKKIWRMILFSMEEPTAPTNQMAF